MSFNLPTAWRAVEKDGNLRVVSDTEAAPTAGQYPFIHVSQVGSCSREASLTLCARGRFTPRGELAGSGSAGSAFSGGGARSLPYRVSTHPRDRSGRGPAVQFGNDLYQKTGDGNC